VEESGDSQTVNKMDLNDFLGPKPIVIDLRAENRWQANDELIDQLVLHHKIKAEHRDAIAESVRKRESSMSTGIGMGIGIPHGSTDLVGEVVGAIGRSRKGIQFDALDGKTWVGRVTPCAPVEV
jgi:mannitol/fructose-specific phosphotransferase system IIA component (Ntr-type)